MVILECPRCGERMKPVVAEGLLGFQRALVPAFRCQCHRADYPTGNEDELRGWWALVLAEGSPADVPPRARRPGGSVVVGEGQPDGSVAANIDMMIGSTIPVCRVCHDLLEETLNVHEDGWYCRRCDRYEMDPMTRAEIPGFGVGTSEHIGAWPVPKATLELRCLDGGKDKDDGDET